MEATASGPEEQLRARESELANSLQSEQAILGELDAKLDALERQLEALPGVSQIARSDFDASNEVSTFPVEGHFKGTIEKTESQIAVGIQAAQLSLRRVADQWSVLRYSSDVPVHQTIQVGALPVSLSPFKVVIPLAGLALEPDDSLVFSPLP